MKSIEFYISEHYLLQEVGGTGGSTGGTATLDEQQKRMQEAAQKKTAETTGETEKADNQNPTGTDRPTQAGSESFHKPGQSSNSSEPASQTTNKSGTSTDRSPSTPEFGKPASKSLLDPNIPKGIETPFDENNPTQDIIKSMGGGEFNVCEGGFCGADGEANVKTWDELGAGGQERITAAYNESLKTKTPTEADKQAGESSKAASADETGTPIPQPGAEKLADPVHAKSLEVGGVKVLNLNDSTNRDSSEAKNHLLDGQLNSTKNTFGTFTVGEGDDAKHYMGFYSEGFGPGDERSGIVELDADGKPKTDGNLGAGEGWKPASAEQKAMLAKAHEARQAQLKELGGGDVKVGLEKLNEIQKLQGRIDNLQTYAAENEGKVSSKEMDTLNSAMELLNKGDSKAAKRKIAIELDSIKFNGYLREQKLSELSGQGFSDEEISKLKESDASIEDINQAIDAKRDKEHQLSPEEKTKFNETIKELETRGTLNDQQKAVLAKLKAMAGKEGNLDKMGKYLQTELNNLANKAPAKQEESRGVNDPIDFNSNEAAKQFKDKFGEEALKSIFGEDYASNPALKNVLDDYNGLNTKDDSENKAGEKFIDYLKNASKDSDPQEIAKKIDAKINDVKNQLPDAEAQKKLRETIAKLEAASKEDNFSKEDASELEELKNKALGLEDTKKAIEATEKLSKALKQYSVDENGKLKRGDETLFLEKQESSYSKTADLNEVVRSVEEQKADFLKFGTKDCGPCRQERGLHSDGVKVNNPEKAQAFIDKMNSLDGNVVDYFSDTYDSRNSNSPAALVRQLQSKGYSFRDSHGEIGQERFINANGQEKINNLGVPALFKRVGPKAFVKI